MIGSCAVGLLGIAALAGAVYVRRVAQQRPHDRLMTRDSSPLLLAAGTVLILVSAVTLAWQAQ